MSYLKYYITKFYYKLEIVLVNLYLKYMTKFKKAFTLIEISIVVVIVWILFILLAKIYTTASSLYVYQTNIKSIEKDILFINQNIQNLVDSTEIDYSKYTNLENTYWFTGNLYLKWNNVKYKIYASWWKIFLDKSNWSNTQKISLTSTGSTFVNWLKFKIIPDKDPFKVFLPNAQQPFVTVFLDIKSRFYNPGLWYQNVRYKLEESFNFRYYNN